jgi:hypothetical protein
MDVHAPPANVYKLSGRQRLRRPDLALRDPTEPKRPEQRYAEHKRTSEPSHQNFESNLNTNREVSTGKCERHVHVQCVIA